MAPESTPARVSWWTSVFDVPGSVRALALLRIVLGPAVLWHLRPFLSDALSGITYRDRFWQPFFSWYPEAPAGLYVAVLWLGVAAAVLMTVGLWTRVACATTLFVVAYNLFLDETHFRHNRAFLVILLVGVTVGASGRVLSLDALRHPPPDDRDSIWPIWLLRFEAASIYFASGFSKLIDPDWVGGDVLYDRTIRYSDQARDAGAPDFVMDVVTTRGFHTVLSPVAVATELFLAFALWHRRTRMAAILVALAFHISIELSAQVEVFSVIAIAALAIWATPSTRDRVLVTPWPWLAWLDWLARFEIRPGDGWEVVDRDGSLVRGRAAQWFALSRLPLTFPVATVARGFR